MNQEQESAAWAAAWRSLGILGLAISLMLGMVWSGWWIGVVSGVSGVLIGYPPSLWRHGLRITRGVAPHEYPYYTLMKPSSTHPENETLRYLGFVEKEIK